MLRISNKFYNFQYFPPSDNPKDVWGGKPPVPPFPGATSQQSSVYYYWWLYLRESDDYIATCENRGSGPCAEVYRDFGDVRDDHFGVWWEMRGCELFSELDEDHKRPTVQLVSEDHDRPWLWHGNPQNEMLIRISRRANLHRAMFQIRAILEEELEEWPDQRNSTALYPVFTKPVLTSLHKCLQVHKLRRDNPSLPLHKFATLSGIYEIRDGIDEVDKSAAASAASRVLKQSALLLKYVGKGMFPVMTAADAAKADALLSVRDILLSREAREREQKIRWRFGSWA